MNQQENAEVLSGVEENVIIVKKTKKVIKKGSPIIVVEKEVVVEKTEDEELEELNEIIRQATEKANNLKMKKDLQKNSGVYLDKLKVSKNNALEVIKLKMVVLQAEKDYLVEEIEALEGINVEEDDIMGFLAENYADFVNAIAFPKVKTAGEVKEKETKVKQVFKTSKPAERWAVIEDDAMFRSKHKEYVLYFKKTAEGIIECDKNGLRIGEKLYNSNQHCANYFKTYAKIEYSISGWEFLQLYNPATGQTKSLKKWNGDVEYLTW